MKNGEESAKLFSAQEKSFKKVSSDDVQADGTALSSVECEEEEQRLTNLDSNRNRSNEMSLRDEVEMVGFAAAVEFVAFAALAADWDAATSWAESSRTG